MKTNIFKGIRLDNKEWVYGDLIQFQGNRKYIVDNKFGECIDENGNFTNIGNKFVCEVDAETVGCCIDLLDKTNTDIYSGDIIKAINRNYDCKEDRETHFQTFKVTYLNGCFMFGNWNAHEFYNKFMFIEIIGNIYNK